VLHFGRLNFSGGVLGLFLSYADREQVEQRHANGDAVGDLFEDAGLRAVSDFGRDFDPDSSGRDEEEWRPVWRGAGARR